MRDWKEQFARQNAFEAEGASAGLSGKARDDCPYDRDTQTEAWNFWVYGCEAAASEKHLIETNGSLTFSSTAIDGPMFSVSLDEALRLKMWKPKWVTPSTVTGLTSRSS